MSTEDKDFTAWLREVGIRVKRARMQRHLSLRELAAMVGMDPGRISKLERGLEPNISLRRLYKLATALDINIDELLHHSNFKHK